MSFMDAREHGSKTGSGYISAQQEAIDRRERLRRLALETIDLSKDPYFMRNHLGQYECRLCLTLHNNEGNYLAHTQGKRHQQNLAKRAAKEAMDKPILPAPLKRAPIRRTVKIGRPGYRVTKQYNQEIGTKSMLFQIEYPEIEVGEKPRHRFMSTIEQKKEPTNWRYQYVLFSAEPYETIAFKIPNFEVDKNQKDHLFTHWDPDGKVYSLQVPFKKGERQILAPPPPPRGSGPSGYPHPGGHMGGMMMPPPPPMMMTGANMMPIMGHHHPPPQQQQQQYHQQYHPSQMMPPPPPPPPPQGGNIPPPPPPPPAM